MIESNNVAESYWAVINELRDELLRRAESGLEPTVFYKASRPRKPYHAREQRGAGWVCRITSIDSPRHRPTGHVAGAVSEAFLFDAAKAQFEGTWRPSTPEEITEFHKQRQEQKRELELAELQLSKKRSLTAEGLTQAMGELPAPLAPGQAGGTYSATLPNGTTITVGSFGELQKLLAQSAPEESKKAK